MPCLKKRHVVFVKTDIKAKRLREEVEAKITKHLIMLIFQNKKFLKCLRTVVDYCCCGRCQILPYGDGCYAKYSGSLFEARFDSAIL